MLSHTISRGIHAHERFSSPPCHCHLALSDGLPAPGIAYGDARFHADTCHRRGPYRYAGVVADPNADGHTDTTDADTHVALPDTGTALSHTRTTHTYACTATGGPTGGSGCGSR